MKPYSSYPKKTDSTSEHVTNEDLLSHFEKRIEGLEDTVKETIKEYIEGCSRVCMMKIEHVNEKSSDATKRIDAIENAVQEIKQILKEVEGSRKTFNWLVGFGIAVLTLLFIWMDIKA